MNMKKIFMAALAAMTLLAGCAKENTPVAKQDIKVNFTVAEKAEFGADTKAVKTGWAVGDEIIIVFRDATGWVNFEDGENTVKLSKTESGWSSTSNITDISLLTGTYYYAVHHQGNIELGTDDGTGDVRLTNYNHGEYLTFDGTYSVSGGNLELGTITMKRPAGLTQISVPGVTVGTDTWTLEIGTANGSGDITVLGFVNQCSLTNIYIRTIYETGMIARNSDYTAIGVQNGADVSFYFLNLAGSAYSGSEIYYKLRNQSAASKLYYKSTTKTFDDFNGHAFLLPALDSGKWSSNTNDL